MEASDGRRNVRRTFWAKYAACPECGALPGNPCRGTYMASNIRYLLGHPHKSRPLKEK